MYYFPYTVIQAIYKSSKSLFMHLFYAFSPWHEGSSCVAQQRLPFAPPPTFNVICLKRAQHKVELLNKKVIFLTTEAHCFLTSGNDQSVPTQ